VAVVQLDDQGQVHDLCSESNGIVCFADRPGDEEFDVRCYQKDFIRVVLRGFQLCRTDNRGGRNVGDIIADEIHNGSLPFMCLTMGAQ
jgi:hypothetical protein